MKKFKIVFPVVILLLSMGLCSEECAADIGEQFPSIVPSRSLLLTFDKAVDTALKNNRDIRVQEEEIKLARAALLGAWSNFLPKAGVSYTYDHNDAVLDVFDQLGKMPVFSGLKYKKDPSIFYGYIDDNRPGFSVKETIFNGGKNIAGLKKARLQLKIQFEELRLKKQLVVFDVKRLYYGLVLAYETERIAKEEVKQAKLHYAEVLMKFDQGTASKFELLQSKVRVSKVLPELVKAKNDKRFIAAQLDKVMGLSTDTDIAVTNTLEFKPVDIDESFFLSKAYLDRPEVIVRNLGVDVRKQEIEIARSGSMPKMNFGFKYWYRSRDITKMFDQKHRNWQAEVTVSIPVFDGLSTAARINETKARYEQAVTGKADLLESVSIEVKKACFDLEENAEIIRALKDSIGEAEEALSIANIGYKNGVVTNLDVIDAQVSLNQVRRNYSGALYDYIMAKAYLSKVMGEDVRQEAEDG